MMKNTLILLFMLVFISCKKDFLDKKPDQSLLIPSSYADLQALLDNQGVMNIVPALGTIGSDNFYATDEGWMAYSSPIERNAYYWADDVYEGIPEIQDWDTPYQQVFYANVVLETLKNKVPEHAVDSLQQRQLEGEALFFRAQAFYQLCQHFCAPYGASAEHLGIVLKLNPNIGQKVHRATIEESYAQILKDLDKAITLLPAQWGAVSRPSERAALALRSRIALIMGNYQQALDDANQALTVDDQLLNYQTLSPTAAQPFPIALPNHNPEVIWNANMVTYSFFFRTQTLIDTSLYKSYAPNDLRKSLFFRDRGNGVINLKGKYTGSVAFFGGLSTDELYLNKAECLARLNRLTEANAVLNTLLVTRWKKDTYVPYAHQSVKEVLGDILMERRKELIGRGLRWVDLRRLNQEPDWATTITRHLNGQDYSLVPGDTKYTWPIPDLEIQQSGIQQNSR